MSLGLTYFYLPRTQWFSDILSFTPASWFVGKHFQMSIDYWISCNLQTDVKTFWKIIELIKAKLKYSIQHLTMSGIYIKYHSISYFNSFHELIYFVIFSSLPKLHPIQLTLSCHSINRNKTTASKHTTTMLTSNMLI